MKRVSLIVVLEACLPLRDTSLPYVHTYRGRTGGAACHDCRSLLASINMRLVHTLCRSHRRASYHVRPICITMYQETAIIRHATRAR